MCSPMQVAADAGSSPSTQTQLLAVRLAQATQVPPMQVAADASSSPSTRIALLGVRLAQQALMLQ
jgi:hypothetical protein